VPEDVDLLDTQREHAIDRVGNAALHLGADNRHVATRLHHDIQTQVQRIVAHLDTHASMRMRPANDAIELLSSGVIHRMDSRNLQRREGRDRRHHFIGNASRAELAATIHRRAQLQAIRFAGVGHARST
jgi:hypothetical protein